MRPQGKVSRIKRCKDKHNSITGENIMINDMKKNELNETEMEKIAGGVMDYLKEYGREDNNWSFW